jgi:surface protein
MRISDLHRRILAGAKETRYIATFNTANTSAGSSASNQVALPLLSTGGTYNFTVEWGDGTSNLITSGTQAERTHTYASAGVYDIKISGLLRGWRFANTGDALKILEIKNWGKSIEYTSNTNIALGSYFGCSNMNFTATDTPVLLGSVAGFFRSCPELVGNSSINNWNVANVLDFGSMFRDAVKFNQNIGSWNVANATIFSSMFNGASAFNQNIGSWNVGNGNIFNQMFQNASAFNQNIGSWNVGNATVMNDMFNVASAFNQNIGSWNVGNVTNFSQMFRNAFAFNQNIGSWNMSKASNLGNFMLGKTAANFSAANLDAIYNGWSQLTFVNTGLTTTFGTAKYTAAGSAGRAILTGAPNNWNITDGGI